MGYSIAAKLAEAGSEVVLVSGPVDISATHKNIQVINVESANEMYSACIQNFGECDGAVMTAAVADFTPVSPEKSKTKRGKNNWNLELEPTKDIAARLGELKRENQILAGFALETNNEMENAKQKLRNKNFDFIVLNSLNDEGAGFRVDTNKITILDRNNNIQKFELKSKQEVAGDIVGKIISLIKI
jgi:phosphopantothenoylcysteine decarboxylase/phosphopantothenate--cysteine ligase